MSNEGQNALSTQEGGGGKSFLGTSRVNRKKSKTGNLVRSILGEETAGESLILDTRIIREHGLPVANQPSSYYLWEKKSWGGSPVLSPVTKRPSIAREVMWPSWAEVVNPSRTRFTKTENSWGDFGWKRKSTGGS